MVIFYIELAGGGGLGVRGISCCSAITAKDDFYCMVAR